MTCTYERETQKVVFPTHLGEVSLSEVELLTLLADLRRFRLEDHSQEVSSEESLMTIEEVARYLKVSKPTIYNWIRNKKAPVKVICGSYRFRKSDIDRYLEGKQ